MNIYENTVMHYSPHTVVTRGVDSPEPLLTRRPQPATNSHVLLILLFSHLKQFKRKNGNEYIFIHLYYKILRFRLI